MYLGYKKNKKYLQNADSKPSYQVCWRIGGIGFNMNSIFTQNIGPRQDLDANKKICVYYDQLTVPRYLSSGLQRPVEKFSYARVVKISNPNVQSYQLVFITVISELGGVKNCLYSFTEMQANKMTPVKFTINL